MKIRSVTRNNRTRSFQVKTSRRTFAFPFVKADPVPSIDDPITELFVDPELAREGFTYVLRSGRSGSIHVDQVLEYNQDPGYMRDLLLYRLTLDQMLLLLHVLDREVDLIVRKKTA